jgi:PelA/Pel-15E family pectate lyase
MAEIFCHKSYYWRAEGCDMWVENVVERKCQGLRRTKIVIISSMFAAMVLTTPMNFGFAAEKQPVSPVEPQVRMITMIMEEPNFSDNGAYHELEEGLYTKPLMKNNAVLAPLKDIMETIGGNFEWSEKENKIILELNNNKVTLFVGQKKAIVNGKDKVSEIAPEIIEGRLFLPVKFAMENLGCLYRWDNKRMMVYVIANVTPKGDNLPLERGGKFTIANMVDQPKEWYGTAQAQKVADVILGYQNSDGGWIKLAPNVNVTKPIVGVGELNAGTRKSTIDNDSTSMQIRLLGRVYSETKIEKYRTGFYKGLDYLLNGQLENGGWQQFFPVATGYQKLITINDDAIANVLDLMRDIENREEGLAFVDEKHIAQGKAAYNKGLKMLLNTQIIVNGKKTAWCQQYAPDTLEPVMGRSFELASLSSQESTKVVRFLMSIDNPSPEVIDAVQSTVSWLDSVKINGIKVQEKKDPTTDSGLDRIIVNDPNASPLWTRFYEIESNKPLFANRDSSKKYSYWEVTTERRTKYNWFSKEPLKLLTEEYPIWQKKWAPENNVLGK